MKADILIVDDEADIRGLIQGILEDEGYTTRQASNSEQAFNLISESLPSLVILDIWLENSDKDGMGILEALKEQHPFLPILMISGHGTIETAVSAIKQGAYDFIEKPFKSGRLLLMIERALEIAHLKRENAILRKKTEGSTEIIGNSSIMRSLSQAVERLAQTNSRVFLTGEPGTGKEIVARTIHRLSQRMQHPFMAVNCAILHPDRLEVELFGSEHGVNGDGAQKGMLERADGGTLLLDEVSDMPLETQGKIVRVLQEQQFLRVGGQEPVEVDVRIIASTNRDLQKFIEKGDFREDLYYRLNVVPLEIPPLRQRIEDIPELAEHFVQSFSEQSGIQICKFSSKCLAAMQSYDWPGNVRQLRNAVEWLMIMDRHEEGSFVEIEHLPPEISNMTAATLPQASNDLTQTMVSIPLREAREEFEREYLTHQIKRFKNNISKTAEFIGMERSALHRKLKQLGITDQSKQNTQNDKDITGKNRIIA